MNKLEVFERAFGNKRGSCVADCACEKTYYNPDPGWSFEEGELDKLEKDPNAIAVDYTVTMISFEGSEYVVDCDCWIERAKQIMAFIDSHVYEIADYINMEKARKIEEANLVPDVKVD